MTVTSKVTGTCLQAHAPASFTQPTLNGCKTLTRRASAFDEIRQKRGEECGDLIDVHVCLPVLFWRTEGRPLPDQSLRPNIHPRLAARQPEVTVEGGENDW